MRIVLRNIWWYYASMISRFHPDNPFPGEPRRAVTPEDIAGEFDQLHEDVARYLQRTDRHRRIGQFLMRAGEDVLRTFGYTLG